MYYNENTVVYYNGEFLKATETKASVYDQSLHYGYAVVESIRSYHTKKGTRIFKAREHYDRLGFSATSVFIPYADSTEELIGISYEVLRRNKFTDAYIRPEEVRGAGSAFMCGTAAELIGTEPLGGVVFTKPWEQSPGAVIQRAYKNLVLENEYNTTVLKVA